MKLQFHPIANVFPLMEGEPFEALVEDIAEHGVLEPITLFEDMILDGRNRYRAAEEADIEFEIVDYEGDDPVGFVISKNLRRRNLTQSQAAMIAADLANMKEGRQTTSSNELVSQSAAAEKMGVSHISVRRAVHVKDHGVKELQDAVRQGRIDVSSASAAADLTPDRQREVAASPDPARALKTITKKQHRELREIELAGRQQDLPVQKFGVIYADPPWDWEPYSRTTGMDRAAANHYPTSRLDELARMEIPAADDCVCFMWATRAMLPQALWLLSTWDFAYKSCFVWHKSSIGTGYWSRDNAELLLIGVKGEVPAPAPGEQAESCFYAAKGAHSVKPDRARAIIESYFPHLPKLEMFARGSPPPGWTCWGNESEEAPTSADVPDADLTSPLDSASGTISREDPFPEPMLPGVARPDSPDDLVVPAFIRRGMQHGNGRGVDSESD